jgi:nucleoporin SEH1
MDALQQWQLQYEWTAHQASVWKVTWAHPEYGLLVASCSFDRTVIVWEESIVKHPVPSTTSHSNLNPQASFSSLSNSSNTAYPDHQNNIINNAQQAAWTLQAQLTDARESVHDVKFAPRHLGLRLV